MASACFAPPSRPHEAPGGRIPFRGCREAAGWATRTWCSMRKLPTAMWCLRRPRDLGLFAWPRTSKAEDFWSQETATWRDWAFFLKDLTVSVASPEHGFEPVCQQPCSLSQALFQLSSNVKVNNFSSEKRTSRRVLLIPPGCEKKESFCFPSGDNEGGGAVNMQPLRAVLRLPGAQDAFPEGTGGCRWRLFQVTLVACVSAFHLSTGAIYFWFQSKAV